MKSTIKIDTQSTSFGEIPCLKILRPKEVLELYEFEDGDYDTRDKLLNNFLKTPCATESNYLFELSTSSMLQNAPYHVTIITPLKQDRRFYTFRHNILNKLVPYDTIVELNRMLGSEREKVRISAAPKPDGAGLYFKINDFFDWLDKEEWASHEERHPYAYDSTIERSKTLIIRDVFETLLTKEERIAAFDNTPKYKWDSEAETAYQALDVAFDWESSPEGFEYWTNVAKKLKPTVVSNESHIINKH